MTSNANKFNNNNNQPAELSTMSTSTSKPTTIIGGMVQTSSDSDSVKLDMMKLNVNENETNNDNNNVIDTDDDSNNNNKKNNNNDNNNNNNNTNNNISANDNANKNKDIVNKNSENDKTDDWMYAESNSGAIYEEVRIEEMEWNEEEEAYFYPCPCGDQFIMPIEDLEDGEDIALCPSCSLRIRVLYDPKQFDDGLD